jgi:hypothetical protein
VRCLLYEGHAVADRQRPANPTEDI